MTLEAIRHEAFRLLVLSVLAWATTKLHYWLVARYGKRRLRLVSLGIITAVVLAVWGYGQTHREPPDLPTRRPVQHQDGTP